MFIYFPYFAWHKIAKRLTEAGNKGKERAKSKRNSSDKNKECTLCGNFDRNYVMVYSDSAKNKSETATTTFENILYLLKGYFPGEMMTLCRKDFRSINQLGAQYSKVSKIPKCFI